MFKEIVLFVHTAGRNLCLIHPEVVPRGVSLRS